MPKEPDLPDSLEKFVLRMPKWMKEKITAAAKETGRSINQEIVSRLELSLDRFSSLEGIVSDVDELKKFADQFGPNMISLWWAVEQLERRAGIVEQHLRLDSGSARQLISRGDFEHKSAEEEFGREFPRLRRRTEEPEAKE